MKRHSFTFLLLCIISVVNAQIPTEPANIQSPNIASLGLYGDIPVSHFTGIPSIEIPLYQLIDNDINIPMSLSYHAAGIRPDQRPGWTGLGWTLQVGGAIYRTVNDTPDELKVSYMGEDKDRGKFNNEFGPNNEFGYYYYHEVLNTPRWNEYSYLYDSSKSGRVAFDTEPDEFSFNFLGYSGKFYLDHLGQWQVQCDKPVKVQFDGTFLDIPSPISNGRGALDQQSFSGFTIYGEDGTAYVFGRNTSSIEYSVSFFRQDKETWTANAWYLTEIITPKGNKATFTYERGNYTNQLYTSINGVISYSGTSDGGFLDPIFECSQIGDMIDPATTIQGKLLSPVYLTSITTSNAQLSFVRSESHELDYSPEAYSWAYKGWEEAYKYAREHQLPTPYFLPVLDTLRRGYPQCLDELKCYKLDEVIISDNKKRSLKNIKFTYDNSFTERLRLSSVTEEALGGEQKNYSFGYNPNNLPDYLSSHTDHWGFNNNRDGRVYAYTEYPSMREPNPDVLLHGVLDKITYPTGGYTRFVFEPHSYRRQLWDRRWEGYGTYPANQVAGGLRIKQIINSSSGNVMDEIVHKEYFYVTDFLLYGPNSTVSSGVLGGIAQYTFEYTAYAFNYHAAEVSMTIFSSQSVLPCINSQGSHIGYSEVIERNNDGSFTRFGFTNFDNGHLDSPCDTIILGHQSPYEPYSSRACERGKMLFAEEYSSDRVKKCTKAFQYERSSENFVRAMKIDARMICPEELYIGYNDGTAYRHYTYVYRLKQETETVFDVASSPIVTTKNYTYNRNGLVSGIDQTVNNGTRKVSYKYPEEYTSGVYSSMVANNVLSPIVEESESLLLPSGNVLPLKKKRLNYKSIPVGGKNAFVVSSIEDSINPSNWRKTYESLQFDSRGNPTSVIINEKPIIYQWDDNDLLPTAVFENARNDYKETARYEEYQATNYISLNPSATYQNVKTYTFTTSKSGIVEIVLPGALGYNWYVSGTLDNSSFGLVTTRSSDALVRPWTDYKQAYGGSITFNVSAGSHTLRISSTEMYKGKSVVTGLNGELYYRYWSRRSTTPDATGSEDVYYQNFEKGSGTVFFGFHSDRSYEGPFTVNLVSSPSKRYIIDYQVFRNGVWNYRRDNFENGSYTIDEGLSPIDDVRVFPTDASATSFNYIPLVGMASRTDARGNTESYEFTPAGRLSAIRDTEENLVQRFDYHLYNQTPGIGVRAYRNERMQEYFTKNDCNLSIGETGGPPVLYVVPAGKHTSVVSQEDANRKASNDLMSNGQQYANENGECTTNIMVSVYNPHDVTYILECMWGVQGSITRDNYTIPPSEKIADTGDILTDYRPVIVHLPRRFYRNVQAFQEGYSWGTEEVSVKSSEYSFDISYDIDTYPDYQDTYVIGYYPFSR